MNKTLEQYIRDNALEMTPDMIGWEWGLRGKIPTDSEFIVRVTQTTDEAIQFYIRPSGRNGETTTFVVVGNLIFDKQ
jgi:hypothetical protein